MLTPIIEILLAVCLSVSGMLGGMFSLLGEGGAQITVKPATPAPIIQERPVASTAGDSYTTIERGNSGEAVEMLQNRLSELGYYTGKVTGKMDSATQLAYKKFERANGFTANGIASPEEQQVLHSQEAVAAQ